VRSHLVVSHVCNANWHREFREVFFVMNFLLCESEIWASWGFGLRVIFNLILFVFHLLIVNFFRVIFANGCRLVKSNHLNVGVLCD
jgi:hypothetical protein